MSVPNPQIRVDIAATYLTPADYIISDHSGRDHGLGEILRSEKTANIFGGQNRKLLCAHKLPNIQYAALGSWYLSS